MSILKSGDAVGTVCNRYTFDYEPLPGLGHFLHTYMGDGNPLPTFCGEPERVRFPKTPIRSPRKSGNTSTGITASPSTYA